MGGAGVLPIAKGRIIIAAGLEQGERAFQFTNGFDKFAGEIMGAWPHYFYMNLRRQPP